MFSSFLVFQASLTSFVREIPVVMIWSAIESVLAGPGREDVLFPGVRLGSCGVEVVWEW